MRARSISLTPVLLTLTCLALPLSPLEPAGAQQLMAGFGKEDISPDHPVATIYTQSDPAKKVARIADPLSVRSTYLSCGGQQVLIISCDLLGLDGTFCGRLKRTISAFGIPERRIAINCSHTHTAPQTFFLRGVMMADEAYMQTLQERIVRSAKTAMSKTERALAGYATTQTNLNVNRVKIGRLRDINALDAPSGPVDNRIKVVRLDLLESGKTALIVSFACHPLTVSADPLVISADFPGRLCSALEALPGVSFAQFLQGCGGDMNPKIHGTLSVVDQYASLLAEEVKGLYPKIHPSPTERLQVKTASVSLPQGPIPTVEEMQEAVKQRKSKGGAETFASRRALSWAEDALEALRSGKDCSKISLLVQGVRLGDLTIIILPGEVFAEIGMEIEKRIGGDVLVAAYSNQAEAGYIPAAEYFPMGGYEVDGAVKYYGLFPYLPEAAQRLISGTVKMALEPDGGAGVSPPPGT